MVRTIIKILILILIYTDAYACNICGGGTSDIAVLALDGKALFNLGFSRENFSGIWDNKGNWHKNNFSQHQYKLTLGTAYRFNRYLQCALNIPVIFNRSALTGLKQNGTGLGDITIRGRYEIFHEFQPIKQKYKIDKTLPYFAIVCGINLPTGNSEEEAENDVDVTGSGFFSSVIGISVTKSILRQKLQIIADLSWQHSFEKKYSSYFGEPVSYDYSKQPGDKISYSLSTNYIINNWHAFSFSITGFLEGNHKINDIEINNSESKNIGFTIAYTYYPSTPFRITSAIKFTPRADNLGLNNQTSDLLSVNLTYYIAEN